MSTRPKLQPDSFTIGGPRLAYDARPWLKPGGRDAEPGGSTALEAAAQAEDPASALMAYFTAALGDGHEDKGGFAQLVEDCARWNGETSAEDAGRRAHDAAKAHDGTYESRARAAADARSIATDEALTRKFPGLGRIGSAF